MQIKTLCAAIALLGAAGVALADDLADGIKAWEKQDFARAHQLLGKLAQSGNPEAQLLVGEMYGFGEGVAEDPAQAESWLTKAKAAGHKDAANSLLVLQQRKVRKADIDFYRSAYTGEELAYAKQGCVAPDFPDASHTQEEIKEVKARMAEWEACYQRFGQGLAGAQPAGKLIPGSIGRLMSAGELQQARSTMDKAYARIAGEGEQSGRQVIAAHDAWAERTKQWTIAMHKKTQDDMTKRSREINDLNERRRAMLANPGMSR
ncbi:hypothetical protein ABT364_12850 [Massilia sp. SR12]